MDIEAGARSYSLGQLLAALRKGGEPESSMCAEELIRRFIPMLRRVWSTKHLPCEYRDFEQSVFVKLFQYLPDLDDANLFPGYFHRVAASVAIDILRRLPRASLQHIEGSELDKMIGDLAAEGEIVTSLYVGALLDRLKGRQRAVIELLYLQAESEVEAARQLGFKSTGAVRKLKVSAIEELRRIVRSLGGPN